MSEEAAHEADRRTESRRPLVDLYLRTALAPRRGRAAAKTLVVAAGILLLGRLRLELPLLAFATLALADTYVVFHLRRGRRPAEVGLGPRLAPPHLAAGVLAGAALMSVVIGVFWLAGWYRAAPAGPSPGAVAYALGVLLFAAALEEILARAVLFRFLEGLFGSWLALAGSALVFGALHLPNPNASPVAAFAIAIEAGVGLGAAWMLTRTLWFPLGVHWAWNAFEGVVYGTPVSGLTPSVRVLAGQVRGPAEWTGGAFGPEAGLVAVAVGSAGGLALILAAIRRGEVVGRPGVTAPGPAARARPDER